MAANNLDQIVQLEEDRIHELRQAIKNFTVILNAKIIEGSLTLGDLYERYEAMEPSMHKECSSSILDIPALVYSFGLLPKKYLPYVKSVHIQKTSEDLSTVPGMDVSLSERRRRTVYIDSKGHMKFIAREEITDNYDIITSLIIFSKEAEKIKRNLNKKENESLRKEIEEAKFSSDIAEKSQLLVRLSEVFHVTYDQMKWLDDELDNKFLEFTHTILNNDYANMKITFAKEFSLTDKSTKASKWRQKLIKSTHLDPGKPISIISSNTHSIVNCLSGFVHDYKDQIVELASKDDELKEIDPAKQDNLYYLVTKLCQKNPEFKKSKIDYEENLGIRFIRDTNDTGIDIQIIDTEKIDITKIDPRIREKIKEKGLGSRYIINIDYAFGRQGNEIMRELCQAFGTRIDDISITGKAGIVSGKRFEIMVPNYFISQIEGGVYEFPNDRNNLTKDDFKNISNGTAVYDNGPMMTVPGTIIQNELVLRHYIQAYGILGLEMEGIPYIEAIEKAHVRKILKPELRVNVAYWGSDNPLSIEENLAFNHMDKGLMPTYVISVAILNKIFGK